MKCVVIQVASPLRMSGSLDKTSTDRYHQLPLGIIHNQLDVGPSNT